MRFTRKAMIAGGIGLALAGAAFAAEQAKYKVMTVALPDGSVQQIRYVGDTPPQISFVAQPQRPPADIFEAAFGADSAFAQMDRISAAMEAQSQAMMRQAATMAAQAPAAAAGKGVTLSNADGQPVGVMHYSYVSSSTDAHGCTQTTSYSSDGQANQPKVIRTASDGCSAAIKSGAAPTPTVAPAAERAPVVTPTSTPKPTPSAAPTTTI